VLKREEEKLESDFEIWTTRMRELQVKVNEANEEKSKLHRETKELQRRKTNPSPELEVKEELLVRLNDIGFSKEDLMRLRASIERISQNHNTNIS
jgi:predicted nuclease with TOPRIM domain